MQTKECSARKLNQIIYLNFPLKSYFAWFCNSHILRVIVASDSKILLNAVS